MCTLGDFKVGDFVEVTMGHDKGRSGEIMNHFFTSPTSLYSQQLYKLRFEDGTLSGRIPSYKLILRKKMGSGEREENVRRGARLLMGDCVRVVSLGRCGEIVVDDLSANPYKVRLHDGKDTNFLQPDEVQRISRDEMEREQRKEGMQQNKRLTVGDCVNIVCGDYAGQCGEIVKDDKDGKPYKVRLHDGTDTEYIHPEDVQRISREEKVRRWDEKVRRWHQKQRGARLAVGNHVKIVSGHFKGRYGMIVLVDDSSRTPYQVRLASYYAGRGNMETVTDWLSPSQLQRISESEQRKMEEAAAEAAAAKAAEKEAATKAAAQAAAAKAAKAAAAKAAEEEAATKAAKEEAAKAAAAKAAEEEAATKAAKEEAAKAAAAQAAQEAATAAATAKEAAAAAKAAEEAAAAQAAKEAAAAAKAAEEAAAAKAAEEAAAAKAAKEAAAAAKAAKEAAAAAKAAEETAEDSKAAQAVEQSEENRKTAYRREVHAKREKIRAEAKEAESRMIEELEKLEAAVDAAKAEKMKADMECRMIWTWTGALVEIVGLKNDTAKNGRIASVVSHKSSTEFGEKETKFNVTLCDPQGVIIDRNHLLANLKIHNLHPWTFIDLADAC